MTAPLHYDMIRLLIVKDWQVYQKQLAGYLAGLILALSLIGSGKPWLFNAGGLLLIVLLVSTGFFAISRCAFRILITVLSGLPLALAILTSK